MTKRPGAEFLVRTTVELPAGMSEQERTRRLAEEHRRARELAEAGTLAAIWRLPGAPANIAVWRVADATELHDLLTGLPLAPWMRFEVTALADHPVSSSIPPSGEQSTPTAGKGR